MNVRLTPEQIEGLRVLAARSPNLLDTSKLVRVAVDFLLLHDLGEVLSVIERGGVE